MEKYTHDENALLTTRDNYFKILERVQNAAVKNGGHKDDVRLMCVTKTVAPIYINAVLDAGADLIGENRVQEYLEKRDELKLNGVERHLIGHLQSNKVSKIVGEVDMIESVSSLKLANEISKVSLKKNIVTSCLVEVNIGKEESKSGVFVEELEDFLYQISVLKGIAVKGLMTVPPICDDNETKKYFSSMYKTYIDITAKKIDNIDMQILSMGMSNDFEIAIAEGSNLVRVGSAIFGSRKYF